MARMRQTLTPSTPFFEATLKRTNLTPSATALDRTRLLIATDRQTKRFWFFNETI